MKFYFDEPEIQQAMRDFLERLRSTGAITIKGFARDTCTHTRLYATKNNDGGWDFSATVEVLDESCPRVVEFRKDQP